MKHYKNFLIAVSALLFLAALVPLIKFFNIRYIPTRATQNVVEITVRSTGPYVDATQAIKDGIAQLTNSGGGVLFFGPGKYIVQQTIDIPSNITIEGVGAGNSGPTIIILGNGGDMNGSGMALLSILPGAENIAIKDIELRSMTPGPDVYPRTDLNRIRDEQTTGLRIYGNDSTQTRNITIQNIRVVNFTYGIDAGSENSANPIIDNVKIKNVASEQNYWALRVRSFNARNWDLQNYNIVEVGAGQSGIQLERSGKMSFLQLFCASTLLDGVLCLDINQRAGSLYFAQSGFEGPSKGFRIRGDSTQPIYFDNSSLSGTVEESNVIYSFGGNYSLTNPNGRINFINNGTQSTLYKCGDVFNNGYPNPSEITPANPYPGLTVAPGCNFDIAAVSNQFSNDILPYQSFDWLESGRSVYSKQLNIKKLGAVGDGVADDTEVFKKAIRDADFWSASTIIVPAGTYKISDTLVLEDGITFQGAGTATIKFVAGDRPLFQVRVLISDAINKRGIGLKNLSLVNESQFVFEKSDVAIDMSGNRGAAGDFIFSDLNISGFTKGIYVHNDSGVFDAQQPQLDTIAVRNLTFTNNGVGIELRDQNASNWNIVNARMLGMKSGQIGIKIDGGGGMIRNLSCQGESSENLAQSCVYLSRSSSMEFDRITSTNTRFAFFAEWPSGWTPYPIVIKNSDLRDGFYTAGKLYLLSVSNIYSDGGQGNPLGSRTAFFNVAGSDDSNNVYPGAESRISSCGDIFRNSSGVTASSLKFVGVANAPQTCPSTPLPTPDTTSPAVSITAPNAGATVSGSGVNVTANASDNIGVVGVQFKMDGANLGSEDTVSPYSVNWDTTSISNGSHTITAVARDAAGNNSTSAAVNVSVNNIPIDNAPPSVSIAAPANGASVSGSSVAISAAANDNVGVVGVQFKVDGTNLGSEDTTSPFAVTWNTVGVSNSSHTLTAVARDAAGNSTISTGVNVTVNNVVPPSTVATPTISPSGGSFTSTQSVALTVSTAGASIRYTTDGSKPSSTVGTLYNFAFSISSTSTVKAIAYKSGSIDSSIASATFTITPPATAATPIISPNGGSFTSIQSVSLSATTPGSTLHFTTDGSTPTGSSTIYNGPITISITSTVKAIAIKTGMADSSIATALFTLTLPPTNPPPTTPPTGGGGTTTPPTIPPTTPPTIPPVIPPNVVVLPQNVIAGQVIKFSSSPTVYLVQSTGLHPFDTWGSFLAYQAQSGVQIITREGTASAYTVSTILAKTILGQTAPPTTGLPSERTNFFCSGNKTVYYYYNAKKEAYSEPAIYEAWNGKNYSSIATIDSGVCSSIPNNGLVRLPDRTIVRVPGGTEIYMISGNTARPFTSYSAYLRDSAGKSTYTISLPYLHTYSRGANIN